MGPGQRLYCKTLTQSKKIAISTLQLGRSKSSCFVPENRFIHMKSRDAAPSRETVERNTMARVQLVEQHISSNGIKHLQYSLYCTRENLA